MQLLWSVILWKIPCPVTVAQYTGLTITDLVISSSKSSVFKETPFVRKPILLVILQAYFSEKAVQKRQSIFTVYLCLSNWIFGLDPHVSRDWILILLITCICVIRNSCLFHHWPLNSLKTQNAQARLQLWILWERELKTDAFKTSFTPGRESERGTKRERDRD